MTSEAIKVENREGVTVLRLDRPPANAVDLSLARELEQSLGELEGSNARALVLTGTGDFFSAGLDLKEVPRYSADDQRAMIIALGRAVELLYGLPIPTVAAVNGHAVAAGTLFTLACDYRIGPEGDFRFGLTGTKVGIPYPVAAQAVIEAELAPANLRTMILTAAVFGPDEARDRGVVDELRPQASVLERGIEMANQMAGFPSHSFTAIKRQLRSRALAVIHRANEEGDDPFLES